MIELEELGPKAEKNRRWELGQQKGELGRNLSFPVDVIIEVPEGEDKTAGREAVINRRQATFPLPGEEEQHPGPCVLP